MNNPISLQTMNTLFDHNYWARDSQLQACAALSDEQLLQPIGGSFTSIRDTLVHMVAVEWLWLERWLGSSPKTLFDPRDFPDLKAIITRWNLEEQNMTKYLSGLNDEDLTRSITCTGTRGNTWTYQLWEMMYHLLNHQSYHRGQVTNYLRQLDLEPARVDFLVGFDQGFRIK